MEGDDRRAPLLGSGADADAGGRPPSLRRRDSARSLRSSFLSRLPDKVRAGLDPERLADLDLSRAKGLSQGRRYQKLRALIPHPVVGHPSYLLRLSCV